MTSSFSRLVAAGTLAILCIMIPLIANKAALCGVLVAGIAGALIAVPLAAAGNAVAQHLASYTAIGDDDPDDDHGTDLRTSAPR